MSDYSGEIGSGKARRFTVRGGVMLAVSALTVVLAYVLGLSELLIVGCFAAAGPVLAVVFIHARQPRLSVQRTADHVTVSRGQPTTVRLTLTNLASSRTTPGLWHDRVPWSPGRTVTEALPPLPPGGRVTLRHEMLPAHRGVFNIGPMVVSFADPFGLAAADTPFGGIQRLVVTPEIVELPTAAVRIATGGGLANRFNRHAPAGEDDLMTRAYRPGDALRRVHWRSSARQGELMVRESEHPRESEVFLLLETRGPAYPDASSANVLQRQESQSFEWALRMTASLVSHLALAGVPLKVVETARPQLSRGGHGDQFMESLARIRLRPSSDGWHGWSAADRKSKAETKSVIAIFADPDAQTLGRLVELRSSCDQAVAFLFVPATAPALDVLRAAGWMCVPVTPHDSVAEVWGSLGSEDG